jgi:excisionase family DNA binding protein
MASETGEQTEWHTLGEASRLLGVHPATVRQWADEGKLASFRTPGGHRRFAHGDIERLLQVSPVRGAGLQSYLITETVERTRKTLPEALAHAAWARHLPVEERTRWRDAGRRLVGLVAQLVTRPSLSAEQTESALSFGRDYGHVMARTGHTLPDAVLAFLFFRDSLLETVLQLPETTGLNRDATLQIVGRVNALLNEVLRAMMEAFEAAALVCGDGIVYPGGESL